MPNNGEPVWVVDTPDGNAVPLLDGIGGDDEESERALEVYAVDVALDVVLELGWLGLVVVEKPVGVLLLEEELAELDDNPGILLKELGQPE